MSSSCRAPAAPAAPAACILRQRPRQRRGRECRIQDCHRPAWPGGPV